MLLKELYDYQIKDVDFAAPLTSVLNANKVGYGKTVESIALGDRWGAERILIISPKTVLYQWDLMYKQWTGNGSIVLPRRIDRSAKKQIVIVNYEQIADGTFEKKGKYKLYHPGQKLQQYCMFTWDLIICDEVQRLKNGDTKTARALDRLPAIRKMGLSGSPILRYPDDLYNILHWLEIPEVGNSYWKFVERYCHIEEDIYGRKPKGLTKDPERVEELRKMLARFTINNPELKVTPGKRVQIVPLMMGPKQRALYKSVEDFVIAELPDNCTVFNAMMQMMRLIQITSHPQLFDCDDNIKFMWIKEFCKDNPATKMVVFSRFSKCVNYLQRYLSCAGISCVTYTGDMSSDQRKASFKSFVDRNVQVIAGTIGAMGVGLDGLQRVCHIGVFVDREWSPSMNEQAEGRLDRSGQENMVDIYDLMCIKTIDKYVGKINMQKSVDIKAIFEGGYEHEEDPGI